MNNKIFDELQNIFTASPQMMLDRSALSQSISATFDVDIEDVTFTCINELVDKIDSAVLASMATKNKEIQVQWTKYH
jgi:hypothetical protein